jgi:hypothetical protein
VASFADRERKRSPHRCECGSAFDVCYFDDRRDPERDREPVTVQVSVSRPVPVEDALRAGRARAAR